MKRTLVLFSFILITACEKSEEPIVVAEQSIIEVKGPMPDFYGIPKKTLSNVVVGDFVKITLEITKLIGADVIELRPNGNSASYHEVLNTDYEMYTLSATEKDKYIKVDALKVVKGVNIFYIKPLVPGTFQINLGDVSLKYPFLNPIVFTAVKIATRIEGNSDSNCGVHKWRRHTYWFSMSSGNQTFDNLLTDTDATYSYSTNYRGSSKTAVFSPNTDLKIIEDVSECENYPAVDNTIQSIEITKTKAGVKQVLSTYYNISIQ
jgi:hypothetical protein